MPSKMTVKKEQGSLGAEKAPTAADRTSFGLEASQFYTGTKEVDKCDLKGTPASACFQAISRSTLVLHTKKYGVQDQTLLGMQVSS